MALASSSIPLTGTSVGGRSVRSPPPVSATAIGRAESFSISMIVSPPWSATVQTALHRVAVGDPQPGLGHRCAVDADLPHGSLLGRIVPAVVGGDVPPDGFLIAVPRLDVTGRRHGRPPGMTRDPGGHPGS